MFFWKKLFFVVPEIKINLKASLRTCHKQIDPNKSDIISNPKNIKNRNSKRTFSLTPSEYQASMCVETSLSFSFFLLFFINVFSIIYLFMTYAGDLTDLQQQGKKLAAYAYITEGTIGRNENDIRLQKKRIVESPVGVLAVWDCRLYTQCVVKPWTGYDVEKGKNRTEEDRIVYMTEYGSVYHKNRACTHLVLSIRAIASGRISEKRNESGEYYVPCEYCGESGMVTVVYITSYGNKYHTTAKCRGLKRNVRSIPLSEVEGVNPCQKCG